MESRFSQRLVRILIMFALVSGAVLATVAQDDPDPNSPTPILLSIEGSTRALAQTKISFGKMDLSRITARAFNRDTKVALYVANLNLMDGEGANAFRVYAQDSLGHVYRFPVLAIEPYPYIKGVYSVIIRVKDEIGYWEQPTVGGDMLVYLTWRGLASNSVKLGVGQMGGTVKDAIGAKPTPISMVKSLPVSKNSGETEAPNYVGYRWSGDRIRFLEQATFGPTSALDSRVRRIGLRTWLAEQFGSNYPSVAFPYPVVPLKPINAPADCNGEPMGDTVPDVPPTCFRDTYSMYLPQTWFYKEALYGDSQLKHRVAWALNQLWVISGFDTQQSSHMIAYHQLLSKNAFGNWRTLMQDMTLNPGMGNYLDMIRSTRTNPNENYPREVLQLFNIGLFMLKPDGTLDCTQHPYPDPTPCQPTDTFIPTYDQNVVNNFTKVFTGWRDCRITDPGPGCPNDTSGSPNYKDPMSLNPAAHDVTAKTLLSYSGSTTTNIAACNACNTTQITTYANNSLNQALDNIYNHPNVAPFVSKYLIQQLVTSDPTPAYVGRISAVFNANRTNPSQLKEVVKAILLDPEARGDVKTDPIYGKLREPVQLMTNLFRQIGVTSADGLGLSDGDVNRFPANMAQSLFFSPTVFNYYPPNYIVPGTALLGPEFAIFNTGTAISRANFGNSMVFGQINVALPNTPNGTRLDFTEMQALAAMDTTTNTPLLDTLNQRMMHGAMSAQMRSTINTAVNAVVTTDPLTRAKTAVYLIVTSSQYQVQK